MSRRFVKRGDVHRVILPGIGLVRDSRVLEGEQWVKYVPSLLTEILDSRPVVESKAQLLVDAPSFDKEVLVDQNSNGEFDSDASLLTEVAPPTKHASSFSRGKKSK